jgi:hypothetical protein
MTKKITFPFYHYLYKRFGDARLALLLVVMLVIVVIGFVVASGMFLIAGFEDGLFARKFCLKSECVDRAISGYKYAFGVASGTVSLLVSIATMGGIFVALLSYLHATSATAFGNHISHLTVFQSYLASEISKRQRIAGASVDVFHWYHLIFPEARSGRLTVSSAYEEVMAELGKEVGKSNAQASAATEGSFRYVDHQNRIILAVSKIGLKLDRQPRVDFFEIEGEVFSLIRSVNSAFCMESDKCAFPARSYR